jgi:dipeptidase
MDPKGCYMMAAGRKATADGSVMVARSCDSTGGDDVVQVIAVPRRSHGPGEMITIPEARGTRIPQVEETYAYLGVMMVAKNVDIHEAEGGINEHQVSAGASTGGWLNPRAKELCPVMQTSIGDYRMTLALERCKTAREAINMIGEMTDRYGARTDNYIVADPNEAWFYEEYQGSLWAAARVPDDCFVIQANSVRIDFVSEDTDIYRCSRNLVSFAAEKGLYDPNIDGSFNPAKVYGAQTGKIRHNIPAPEYDRRRLWRGISLLAPSTKPDPEQPTWTYPLFLRPDEKLRPRDFLALFEDHYQGTNYDPYGTKTRQYKPTHSPMVAQGTEYTVKESPFHINDQREYQLAPNWGTERLIGTPRSITNWCAQLRGWMPDSIGGLIWAGVSEGATTGRIPFYCGINETPRSYTTGTREFVHRANPTMMNTYNPESAYWSFRIVTNLVNLFYTATKDEVILRWRKWEAENYKLQPSIEKIALELYQKNPELAKDFVTTYSCAKANEALEIAEELIARLHTIISHYNAPL